MKIVHTYVKFKDAFSGAIQENVRTLSEGTFNRAVDNIGKHKRVFDKEHQIVFNWQLVDVRQAAAEDYKRLGIQTFENTN